MRLLLLTPGFPQDESDTTCVPYLQVWVKEASRFFEIKIITFQYPYTPKHYYWNGIEVYAAGGKNRRFPFRILIWFRILIQAFRWNRQSPFERISSFWVTEASFMGSLAGRLFRIPHDSWIFGQDAKKENRYPEFIFKKNTFYIAISPSLARDFEANHRLKPSALIPLGLSIPAFSGVNPQRTIDVVGLGSLTRLKHYEQFVEIVGVLKADFPSIRALIMGDGPEREALQRQIDIAGLSDNVVLAGRLGHEQVYEQLRNSRILLHTSEYEGQGVAYWEALACGCYIVAKPVGYLPDTPKTFASEEINALVTQAKYWLSLPKPDYTPFVYEISRTIDEYREFIHRAI
ncbi:MAG: glycosyltransferase [Bacteroidia bacterium]|nr:glycosyltransferase [Bacteroidia bacterium]